jgi:hypothetical protein
MASKHYHFKFNFDSDKEIISRIEEQENKNDYIRSLILSDIAADILRSSIKLEEVKDALEGGDTHAVHEPVTSDVESFDFGEMKEQAMIDYYNENCPAISNHDPETDYCSGCQFDDGSICRIEEGWEKHWNHVLYKAVGGADRDYPAEFKGLKKAQSQEAVADPDCESYEDYMVNLRKISKTHLNSLYGKMASNASNALDNDIKKGDPDNG